MRIVEEYLGETRFGGAWFDRSIDPPSLRIAIVEPTQADIDVIRNAAAEAGWVALVESVRHSQAELVGLLEAKHNTRHPGNAWISLSWSPQSNAVHAMLSSWDEEAVAWARTQFPADALRITIHPFAWVPPQADSDE